MDDLLQWKANRDSKCLLIEGARQVGKTYIIREFGRTYGHFVELNFELHPEQRRLFTGDLDSQTIVGRINETMGSGTAVPGDTLIFLDEIQSCPTARTSLKSFAVDPDFAAIASGSLLGVNYREVPSYPVGYEQRLVMNSLDFEEFSWAFGVSTATISTVRTALSTKKPLDSYTLDLMNKYFSWYLAVGGMPAAVLKLLETRDFDLARKETTAIKEGYRNDAAKYAPTEDRNRVFDCFRSIPDQLAKEEARFRYSAIRPEQADSQENTAAPPPNRRQSGREYRSSIDWLLDAGVCLECRRVTEPAFPLRGDRELFKLYLRDTGILSAMNSRSTMAALIDRSLPANRGAVMENAVADLLNKAGLPLYYYKKKSTEVDFITDLGGTVAGIEVKSGNNPKAKSLNSLLGRGLIGRGLKLENGNICVDEAGVEHYPQFAAGFADSLFELKQLSTE